MCSKRRAGGATSLYQGMAFSPEHSTSRCVYGHHSRAVVGIPRLSCTAATSIHSRSSATGVCESTCRFGFLGVNRFSRTEPHIPYTLFRRALSAEPRADRDILGRASKLPPSSLGPETQQADGKPPAVVRDFVECYLQTKSR